MISVYRKLPPIFCITTAFLTKVMTQESLLLQQSNYYISGCLSFSIYTSPGMQWGSHCWVGIPMRHFGPELSNSFIRFCSSHAISRSSFLSVLFILLWLIVGCWLRTLLSLSSLQSTKLLNEDLSSGGGLRLCTRNVGNTSLISICQLVCPVCFVVDTRQKLNFSKFEFYFLTFDIVDIWILHKCMRTRLTNHVSTFYFVEPPPCIEVVHVLSCYVHTMA